MSRYENLVVIIKRFPESQEVMDKEDWFPIQSDGSDLTIGYSAYGRILNEDEYILVEKTTADEFNDVITGNDPGDENNAT